MYYARTDPDFAEICPSYVPALLASLELHCKCPLMAVTETILVYFVSDAGIIIINVLGDWPYGLLLLPTYIIRKYIEENT